MNQAIDTNRVNLNDAISKLSTLRSIDRELLLEKVKEALEKGYNKEINPDNDLIITMDPKTEELILTENMKVVDKIFDRFLEVTLETAKKNFPEAEIGQTLAFPVFLSSFSYFAIMKVSQVIKHFLNISESEKVYDQFIDKKGLILSGTIENIDYRYFSVNIGNIFAFINREEQIPNERIYHGKIVKFYVLDVFKNHPFGQVMGSRRNNEFLAKLFALEVPEVTSGIVKIEKVVREPGTRAKVAVSCEDESIDPIGSCIGRNGKRISAISNELNGEKIDIFMWDEDLRRFMINACSPSKVVSLKFFENNTQAQVIVLETQYPVSIGKNGSAIRLLKLITNVEVEIVALETVIEKLDKVSLNGNLSLSDLEKLELAPEILAKCYDIRESEETD